MHLFRWHLIVLKYEFVAHLSLIDPKLSMETVGVGI